MVWNGNGMETERNCVIDDDYKYVDSYSTYVRTYVQEVDRNGTSSRGVSYKLFYSHCRERSHSTAGIVGIRGSEAKPYGIGWWTYIQLWAGGIYFRTND